MEATYKEKFQSKIKKIKSMKEVKNIPQEWGRGGVIILKLIINLMNIKRIPRDRRTYRKWIRGVPSCRKMNSGFFQVLGLPGHILI